MNSFNKLLVVLDPADEQHKALKRALHMARLNPDCKLTLFLSIYDFSYEMTTMLSSEERDIMRSNLIADRKAWIDDLLSEFDTENMEIEKEVVWHNRPFEAIIEEVLKNISREFCPEKKLYRVEEAEALARGHSGPWKPRHEARRQLVAVRNRAGSIKRVSESTQEIARLPRGPAGQGPDPAVSFLRKLVEASRSAHPAKLSCVLGVLNVGNDAEKFIIKN